MSGGIYKITNKINGRIYIGRAMNFESRWGDHKLKLKTGKHNNRILQNDWSQYGPDSFVFEILETIEDRSLMAKREHEVISQFFDNGKNCYNLIVSSGAAKGEGLSPAQRQKRRMSILDEVAREKGYGSWRKFETAALRGEIKLKLRWEKESPNP